MKKIITSLLFTFLVVSVFGQVSTIPYADQSPAFTNPSGPVIRGEQSNIGCDVKFSFPLGTENLGYAAIGSYNNEFWVAKWASNVVQRYDANGNLLETFTFPLPGGVRAITRDGDFFWLCDNTTTIHKYDIASRTIVATLTTPIPIRGLSYDDSGAKGFWISNFDTDILKIDLLGNTVQTIPFATHGISGIYGIVIDNISIGGPYLHAFAQSGTSFNEIHTFQLSSSTVTSTKDAYAIVNSPALTSSLAGGLFLGDFNGQKTIMGLFQGTPQNLIFGLNLQCFVPNCALSAPTLTASKTDVCPNTEVTLTANCSDVGAVVNWNPGAPTVTPNAPDVAYTYKASCSLNGCTSDESSVVVRTHRILVDLKDVGLGAQPKAIVGPKKDNLAPTNAISAAVSPRLWTILATGCSSSESAVFKLTGPVSFSSIDNNPPYAIFANVGATYFAQDHPNYGNGGSSFPDGTYNLVVDLRAADGVGGPFPKNRIATGSLLATRSLQFTVSASGARLGGEDLSLEELNWASIFQNPVSEEIVVRLSGSVGEEVSLGLVNLQGQTVHSRQVKLSSPQQYEVLNVRQQNAGMYILKAIKGDKVKTIKVVKAE